MEKKKLISFIDKYHLAGNANSVKLEIKDKTKRKSVTGINTFLTDYHGSSSSSDNGKYVKAIRDILDRKN